jgi:hypothetical protein
MRSNNIYRYGAVAGFTGAISLFVGTLLHPAEADPNDPLAAFAEYAAHHDWVAVHLIQLLGVALMVAAVFTFSIMIENGRGGEIARLGNVGAAASLTLAATLQAVDGVALKVMVDRWVAATGPDKDMLFYATFGVRQIEVGTASMFCILMGCTLILYGGAQKANGNFSSGLVWLAYIGGLGTAAAGVVMSQTGFSDATMLINMPANLLLLVWMALTGIWMWKNASSGDNRIQGR